MGALRAFVAAGGCAAVLAITATPAVAAPTVGCQQAPTGVGRLELKPQRDVVIGPVVIRFAAHTVGKRRDAWGGVGYKLPLSLSAGTTAVVSVPPRLRNRVRLVYNQPAQRRVERRGVRGGSKAVRFEACPGAEGSYSSWSGGIAVAGRRCAILRVRVPGSRPSPGACRSDARARATTDRADQIAPDRRTQYLRWLPPVTTNVDQLWLLLLGVLEQRRAGPEQDRGRGG